MYYGEQKNIDIKNSTTFIESEIFEDYVYRVALQYELIFYFYDLLLPFFSERLFVTSW